MSNLSGEAVRVGVLRLFVGLYLYGGGREG
jgi:hypothetical protein